MEANVSMPSSLDRHLEKLVVEMGHRSVGSPANQKAVAYAADTLNALGWEVALNAFDCMDWDEAPVRLQVGSHHFTAYASPYSPPCNVRVPLVAADSLTQLQAADLEHRILFISGDLAKEQLMPKNFVFYNPEEHRHLIALLEEKNPAAIICATGPGEGLSKGLNPYPVFEDGDFHIPSVYMKEEDGERLLHIWQQQPDEEILLAHQSRRIPSTGHNPVARKIGTGQKTDRKRILICAHIDAKKTTPGALDNTTGVAVLLSLAEALQDYRGRDDLEIIPFNGEDYYAVSGQMNYLQQNDGKFDDIRLVINIDGAGHVDSRTALSFYNLSEDDIGKLLTTAGGFSSLEQGEAWYEGDHSIFLQQGVPCMTATSSNLRDGVMTISHTSHDTLDKVNLSLLEELVAFLRDVIITPP
ncbi:M28 family peptidase [Anoxynatronum buryatiense]|uniref:Carboxypeptidase Q n=1 Tax=Anoxynatronum buryatiense TaxID=489973 RepID=A0AA45WY85_9CLOT|nr:M28 family peptidase [Anoxynatronum buryatiense]SMP65921.1 aminopeptidase YwaD [Anoxynatronum buryatiense]